MKTLRGVNLGGWLVLERWMTPDLFAGTEAEDEFSFMQTPDARQKLRDHQKMFIREEDFRWLRDNGVNAVRIPVGYWIFEGDGPLRSHIGRLDWAVRMAKKYSIEVLICLHGAPGSQNGHDHSGNKGEARWHDEPALQAQTVDVLRRLAERYKHDEQVWGIELLNEPKTGLFQKTLRRFYKDAYRAIAEVGRPGLVVVYHDAFTPRLLSGALWPYREHPVYLDHHWYHFFMPRFIQPHIPFKLYYLYLKFKKVTLRNISKTQPVIIGEWNGIIGGEKLNKYPQQQHNGIVAQHLAVQFEVFGEVAGWFYWSYKTQERGIFHFRSLVEDGVITMPKTD